MPKDRKTKSKRDRGRDRAGENRGPVDPHTQNPPPGTVSGT